MRQIPVRYPALSQRTDAEATHTMYVRGQSAVPRHAQTKMAWCGKTSAAFCSHSDRMRLNQVLRATRRRYVRTLATSLGGRTSSKVHPSLTMSAALVALTFLTFPSASCRTRPPLLKRRRADESRPCTATDSTWLPSCVNSNTSSSNGPEAL